MNADEQLQIICKGAAQIIGEEELSRKLADCEKTGRPLLVKLGLDPSAPDIHLGHAVVLRKIRQIQDLGHRAAIIIGDFTGRIGDPTGKSKTRRQMTAEEVRINAKTYEDQIFRIIDRGKTAVYFNSEWLSALDFEDVLRLAGKTTVARLLERDDFAGRYARKEPIGLHEFFYPLMQAYDSVFLKADIELGGMDQTFNILMGRTIQKSYGQESQAAIFMPLLPGTDGVEKMSKSLGNAIGIQEDAAVMFRKIMQIPDSQIITYCELATDIRPDVISGIRCRLANPAVNPRDVKMELAREITTLYHAADEAIAAEKTFRSAFQLDEIPEGQQPVALSDDFCSPGGDIDLPRLLVSERIVKSCSEARRLIAQGGLRVNGEKFGGLTLPAHLRPAVVQAGKGRFLKLE